MADNNILIWLLFAAIFIVCAGWHARENRQLAEQWNHDFDPNTARWLVRFTWARSLQLLLALACFSLIIVMYDIQLSQTRKNLSAAIQNDQQQQQIIRELNNRPLAVPQPAPVTAAPVIQPAPALATPIEQQPLQPAAVQPVVQPPEAAPKATVDDVYNPEKKATDSQSGMDDIKKRYEDILVLYMFLKKCGRATPEDYHIITSALGQEMATVNAPGRLQADILSSAQGSYKEIYSKSSCSGDEVNGLYAQYTDYINLLSNNLPVQ